MSAKLKIITTTDLDWCKSDDGDDALLAVISTATVDRDREVILPSGIDLKDYKANPVVLWAHDKRMPPVGKCENIKCNRKQEELISRTVFAPTAKGQETKLLYQKKFMRAFSVGLIPVFGKGQDFGPPTDDELKTNRGWKGEVDMVYRKTTMIEYSTVPVPANPEALARAVANGSIELSKGMMQALGIEEPRKPKVGRIVVTRKVPMKIQLERPAKIDREPLDLVKYADEQLRIGRGEIVIVDR